MNAWQRFTSPLPVETRLDAYAHAGFWYLVVTTPCLIMDAILWKCGKHPDLLWPFIAFALALPIIRWLKVIVHIRGKATDANAIADSQPLL